MKRKLKFHIGLRTLKTAAAVILAMLLVDIYGTTSSKLIFAMLGAMAAVQPTFKETVESCLTQIIGVLFGAAMGVLMRHLPIHPLAIAGIGVVVVITLYNAFRVPFAPSLPCMIVVMICTAPDIVPFEYALGRIWDSAIGLGVGFAVNMLIFPYDNSRRIRATAESLDREVIAFLENMFDGDTCLPDTDVMTAKVSDMALQLEIFSNQRLIMKRKKQTEDLEIFRLCQHKAKVLIARMEVLSRMDAPGVLSRENCELLRQAGANISQEGAEEITQERDIVINYHVRQILALRAELLEVLKK